MHIEKWMGEHATGNTDKIVEEFLKLADAATSPSGTLYRGGAFPDDEEDVREFLRKIEAIDDFQQWNSANPPNVMMEATRENIGQDLHNAILAAPDFMKESAEPILQGSYNALAMSKGSFKKFQKENWKHDTRHKVAIANTLKQTSVLKNDMNAAIANVLAMGPSAAKSSFLWGNAKFYSLRSKDLQSADKHEFKKATMLEWMIGGAIVLGIGYYLISGAASAWNSLNNTAGSGRLKKLKEEKEKATSGSKKNRSKKVSKEQGDLSSAAETRKAARERELWLREEEVYYDIRDRGMQIVRHSKKVPPQPDIKQIRDQLRVRDAKQLRSNISNSTNPAGALGGFDNFSDMFMRGSFEQLIEYLDSAWGRHDALRGLSKVSGEKRRNSFLSGFANVEMPDPLSWSDDYWN